MTTCAVTYRKIENIHIPSVKEINARIIVMARPKSSLCMYTSTKIPRYVVVAHIITVIIYII